MLVGREVANTDNGALGCTLESAAYEFSSSDSQFRIHDTAGLNEGDAGRVPSKDAILRLCKLIYGMSEGVSLLVFCIRAPRIVDSVKHNWTLFYDIICRKKVPVLLVVTGLEEEGDMDAWCRRLDNLNAFQRYGIHFTAMTGVMASRGRRRANGVHVYQEEYDASADKLRKLIEHLHLPTPWIVERLQWFREIYKTKYKWELCEWFPYQAMVGWGRTETTGRLISDCGMSVDDAESLAHELEKL